MKYILSDSGAWMYRLVILCLLCCPLTVTAQRIKKVSATYVYYAEADESQVVAKEKALQQARNKAIEKEFGSKISQTTTQEETADDGVEHSFFSQLSTIELEGEWIEDVGEPMYDYSLGNNGQMIVKCTVSGRARQKTNKSIEFEATVLRAYPELKNADVHFRDNENMFLHFQAPANGYIAVYLTDESRTASCLLPYDGDADGQQKVEGGKDYIFFCWDKAEIAVKDIVQQYTLCCANNEIERNKLHVIFSKNPFTKAVDHQVAEGRPRELTEEEFNHWLHRQQAHDPEMGYQRMNIEIRK